MHANRKINHWLRAILLSLALFPVPLRAEGPVALMLSSDLSSYREAAEGFRQNFDRPLQEYVLPGSKADQAGVAESIRAQSPKIIVAVGSKAAVEALNHFPQIPLVYCMVIDPERQGLAGRKNAYGISFTVKESVLFSKYKAALPQLRRLGLIIEEGAKDGWIRGVRDAGEKMGIEIVAERVKSNSDIPNAMRNLSGKIDAFWMTTDPVVTNKFAFNTISNFCTDSRIPLLVPVESLVSAGGLLSVTSSGRSTGAEAAALAKALLDGKPPESALVQPVKLDLAISQKEARKIGIDIPESVLRTSKQLP